MKRNVSKEIKSIARERIGQPRPKKIIESKKSKEKRWDTHKYYGHYDY